MFRIKIALQVIMIVASIQDLRKHLDSKSLIASLRSAFSNPNMNTPARHHYTFGKKNQNNLLLMPAWSTNKYVGVKIVTVFPENKEIAKPTIQGTYTLSSAKHGTPLLHCDAKMLTLLRTAATSALASTFLSRKSSEHLLMIGTGSLAPYLIRAHCSVRPIKKVEIWGRNFLRAQQVMDAIKDLKVEVEAIEYLDQSIPKADIISCATMSTEPLVKGEWVVEGTHVDLVGSYLPTMRESDDALLTKSAVYVDDYDAVLKESGDIIIPMRKGVFRKSQIKGSLYELCRIKKLGRPTQKSITVFKSVGLALEDLAAAGLLYEKMKNS